MRNNLKRKRKLMPNKPKRKEVTRKRHRARRRNKHKPLILNKRQHKALMHNKRKEITHNKPRHTNNLQQRHPRLRKPNKANMLHNIKPQVRLSSSLSFFHVCSFAATIICSPKFVCSTYLCLVEFPHFRF